MGRYWVLCSMHLGGRTCACTNMCMYSSGGTREYLPSGHVYIHMHVLMYVMVWGEWWYSSTHMPASMDTFHFAAMCIEVSEHVRICYGGNKTYPIPETPILGA